VKRYWIAHVRGADFTILRAKGFVVFYPTLDDYVFLEVTDDNWKFVSKQTELSIYFLKSEGKYQEVTEEELDLMRDSARGGMEEGARIKVVGGYCTNLDGSVLVAEDQRYFCKLNGFKATYEVWLDALDVVLIGEDDDTRLNTDKGLSYEDIGS